MVDAIFIYLLIAGLALIFWVADTSLRVMDSKYKRLYPAKKREIARNQFHALLAIVLWPILGAVALTVGIVYSLFAAGKMIGWLFIKDVDSND